MKLFLIKLFLIIFIICIIDITVGIICKYWIYKLPATNTFVSKTKYSVLDSKADILILGSSKAKHSYDPFMISDSLGLSCYNEGEDGCDMLYMDMMLSGQLWRHFIPKIVILDIATLTLGNEPSLDKIKWLYGISPVEDKFFIENFSWKEKVKMRMALYRYNGFIGNSLSSLVSGGGLNQGFSALYGTYNGSKPITINSFKVKNKQLKYFDDVINKIRKNKIKLFVFVSPSFKNDNRFRAYLQKFCEDRNIRLFDFSRDRRFLYPSLFKDEAHLNADGAKLYTKQVINIIQGNN